jgi:hypothetical protein
MLCMLEKKIQPKTHVGILIGIIGVKLLRHNMINQYDRILIV